MAQSQSLYHRCCCRHGLPSYHAGSWRPQYCLFILCTLLATSAMSDAWKWHVETGPNLPPQDDVEPFIGPSRGDSDSLHQEQLQDNSQHAMRDRMLGDQPYAGKDVGQGLGTTTVHKTSGIESQTVINLNPKILGTTQQNQVENNALRSHLQQQMQQQNSKEFVDIVDENPKTEHNPSPKETDSRKESIAVENVSEAVEVRNTLGVPPGIPAGNPDASLPAEEPKLQNLVATLQEQLLEAQTSQVRTRSILNVIQETQATQAKDLQALKDALEEVRTEQVQDQQTIRELQKVAEDNEWGVSNLKTSADLIRSDFTAFKALQLSHNQTMIELETLAVNNDIDHDTYHNSIKHMQHEIHSIKNQMEQDRTSLNQLSDQFQLRRRHATIEYSPLVPNNIPAIPAENKYDVGGTFEGSGDKSGEVNNKEFDHFASSIEERHNIIGHRIRKILAKERQMEEDMLNVQERFTLYDNDLSKLYNLFLNLSRQMNAIESNMLNNQQAHFQTELQNLQQGFVNFTQQILTLQQWHVVNGNPLSKDQSPKQSPSNSQFDTMISRHEKQMKDIEHSVVDAKAASQQNVILMNNRIALLNNTIRDMRKLLTDHNVVATDAFDEVGGRVMDFNTRIQHNDDRLSRLEVKVLNATLAACQKTNSDLRQDNDLHSLEKSIGKLNKRSDDLSDRISKLERGLSNLYEVADTQGSTLTKIMDGVHTVLNQLPEIKGLKKEVNNFIMELPPDCSAVRAETPAATSGTHLIHPRSSPGTALVPCEFDGDDTWTIIQKRNSGKLSFAKTWDEYKYGFGDPRTEYWLGNDNLHYLTSKQGQNYRLHISMWDLDGQYWVAEYDHFRVDAAEDSYALHIDGYHGNATDAMKYSNYMSFSTLDHDNDVSSTHCAKFYTAGWWYKHCQYANLNGRFTVGIVWFNHDFDEWVQMQRTEMKIAPQPPRERHYNLDNSTEKKDNNAT